MNESYFLFEAECFHRCWNRRFGIDTLAEDLVQYLLQYVRTDPLSEIVRSIAFLKYSKYFYFKRRVEAGPISK